MRGHSFDPWLWKAPHAVEQLSPHSTAAERLLKSLRAAAEARRPRQTCAPNVRRGPPAVRSLAPQGRAAPPAATRESPCTATKTQRGQK